MKTATRKRQRNLVSPGPIPGTLTPGALEDLLRQHVGSERQHDRLVSILNEFGRRIAELEAIHRDEHDG